MLDALKALIAAPGGARPFGPQDLRVAAAVLLVDVIGADGVASGVERERLQELLMERFSLDEASALRLMDIAERRDRETLDGREFADALARALDESARREIVAMTWEIARADGRVSEVEESAIWRIARLLGVLDPKGFAEEAMRDWQGPETAATNAPPSKPSGETSR